MIIQQAVNDDAAYPRMTKRFTHLELKFAYTVNNSSLSIPQLVCSLFTHPVSVILIQNHEMQGPAISHWDSLDTVFLVRDFCLTSNSNLHISIEHEEIDSESGENTNEICKKACTTRPCLWVDHVLGTFFSHISSTYSVVVYDGGETIQC